MNIQQKKYHDLLNINIMADIGLEEIPGKSDNPKIKLAHELCNVDWTGGTYMDEVPWCASMMNLWILITNYQFNPAKTREMLERKNVSKDKMIQIADYAWKRAKQFDLYLMDIPEPTWSPAAISFSKWGMEVKPGNEEVNMLCLLRRSGGNHIAQYISHGAEGRVELLGGNQSNMVCLSDNYYENNILNYRVVKL